MEWSIGAGVCLMGKRLGEILVQRGYMTIAQVEEVLLEQARSKRPFGEIAEQRFEVTPQQLESAWAEQYANLTASVDPRTERVEPDAVSSVSARQAWQFGLLPLRRDGRELLILTTQQHLPRALRFAYRHFGLACYFVLCSPERLTEALEKHRPMHGASELFSSIERTRAAALGDSPA